MSESFKRILRTKSAEQLTNMFRNKEDWSKEQQVCISEEIKNRGLDVFEEPEEWSDEVMAGVDLNDPKDEFERNMAFLQNERKQFSSQKGIRLASQIVSISALIISFMFFYLYISMFGFAGISNTILLSVLGTGVGIGGLILYILKSYMPSLVVSGISLLISLLILLFNLNELT